MYVFVCYKKSSVTFDPNNAKFTQKIDDCGGWVINFIQPKNGAELAGKNLKMCLVTMKNCILFTGD